MAPVYLLHYSYMSATTDKIDASPEYLFHSISVDQHEIMISIWYVHVLLCGQ